MTTAARTADSADRRWPASCWLWCRHRWPALARRHNSTPTRCPPSCTSRAQSASDRRRSAATETQSSTVVEPWRRRRPRRPGWGRRRPAEGAVDCCTASRWTSDRCREGRTRLQGTRRSWRRRPTSTGTTSALAAVPSTPSGSRHLTGDLWRRLLDHTPRTAVSTSDLSVAYGPLSQINWSAQRTHLGSGALAQRVGLAIVVKWVLELWNFCKNLKRQKIKYAVVLNMKPTDR